MSKNLIIKLRNQTGAGVMDIKEALEESGGDEEKALAILRKQGQKMAAKRAKREAGEGFIGSYVHGSGKAAALVKLQCETDFVARNEEFRTLARELAMQVVAMRPLYVAPADVPAEIIAKEKAIYAAAVAGKSADMLAKIMSGKLEKFYSEVCLLKQPFIKDEAKTIEDLLTDATGKIGEKIAVTGFSRVEI